MAFNILTFIICILICELAGFMGSIFNIKSIPGWYKKLKKPRFNPPNWIFGPVWTILYFLMGISLYLIVSQTTFNILAIVLFIVQLFLNILWSAIFFGMKKPFYSFLEIILLWASILATIILFYQIYPLASYILIPYLLWVTFALILNFKIWILNK